MEGEAWISPRRLAEIELDRKVKAFDRLVDMALDGWQGITVPEAIEAYKHEEGLWVPESQTENA